VRSLHAGLGRPGWQRLAQRTQEEPAAGTGGLRQKRRDGRLVLSRLSLCQMHTPSAQTMVDGGATPTISSYRPCLMYQLTTEAEAQITTSGATKIADMREVCRSYGRDHGFTGEAAVDYGIHELFGSPQQFRLALVSEIARDLNLGEAEILYALTDHHVL